VKSVRMVDTDDRHTLRKRRSAFARCRLGLLLTRCHGVTDGPFGGGSFSAFLFRYRASPLFQRGLACATLLEIDHTRALAFVNDF